MQRRGHCVHQQNLQASLSSSTSSSSSSSASTHPPVPKRNIAAAACLRLYEEGLELLAYKKQLYDKFGLVKVPIRKATVGSTALPMTSTKKRETSSAASSSTSTSNLAVNQESRATINSAAEQGIKSRYLVEERRGSTVYVPPGGRMLAKTYSLQSTMESRAAVAPPRKVSTTCSKKPPSPTNSTAKRETGATRLTAKHERPTSAQPTAASTAINRAANASLGTAQVIQRQQNHQPKQNSRASITESLAVTATKTSRASTASTTSGRSTPMQQSPQKSRTYSTIFEQQQQRQEPCGSIGPASPSHDFDNAGSSLALPLCSPRTSFIRHDNKLEKLQEQVNVLKASLGISEEDLLWKVESSKGNAFLAADRHLAACEERYDRLVFEMQQLSQPARCADEDDANSLLAAKLCSLEKQAQQVAELKARATAYQIDMVQTKKTLMAVRVDAELQCAKQDTSDIMLFAEQELALTSQLEGIKEDILTVQNAMRTEQSALQTLLEWLGSETDRFGASIAAEILSPSFVISERTLEIKRALLYTLRTIPECAQGSERLSTLCTQATQLAAKITTSRAHDLKHTEAELERTMRDVEIWRTRREQAKEFADELRKKEAEWQKKQREKNDESLALMRTFIPVDIADLSVDALITRAQERGVLYTYDLATYLKTNRFLHWLVTHEDDIARANFLAIESASFFVDFMNYDVNERRALARVLPDVFAFDKDGRKNTWRTSFIDHVRQLAAQQQRETIKAGWDPVQYIEIDTRLDKFDRQRARIESKRMRLKQLDDELIPQAKAEYVAVAEDARNEDLQRSFGKATLIALREQAKQQHLVLCKDRDTVRGELAHGDRAWAAMTPSFEQYQAEVAQVRALDPEIRHAFRIRGPFPADIDIQPRERAAFKKLSVEEEAEARKRELDHAIAKRSLSINEVTVEEASAAAAPIDNLSVVEVSSSTDTELEATRLMQLEDKLSTVDTESEVASDLPLEAAPSRGFKRIKSLQVAVGVLQFLENDFCSPKRVVSGKEVRLQSPFRKSGASASVERDSCHQKDEKVVRTPRGRRSTPLTPKSTTESDIKVAKDLMAVQPKSKALLKLVEARKAEETGTASKPEGFAPPPTPSGGGKVNFLGELQNRFQRKSSDSASEFEVSSANATSTATKSLNFMDEMKRKTGGDASSEASSKTPMNFLVELKTASTRRLLSPQKTFWTN
ncbi:hypothetical protein GN244_ATG13102 [Phytophthora infestans]|uniref:Uncharacterized protein n=1 Tax=Phytophthora infestans TaxID=4787 RepID=A0A833T0I0_PHYIN|nr:hypothetical protein GN244_ATG13102 [Phytophthora infestans]